MAQASSTGAHLPIIDAHHHLWDLSKFAYPWLAPQAPPRRFGDHTAIKRTYLPADYRLDVEGLNFVQSVHVQANCGASDPVEETAWLQGLAEETGLPGAAVAEADLMRSDAAHLIARHAAYPITRGVRAFLAWDKAGRWRMAPQAFLMADRQFRQGVAALADHALSLDLVIVPEQLPEVADLAGAFPGLSIAINHLAQPEPDQPGSTRDWRSGMAAIAPCRNVKMKVSGLWTIDTQWDPDALRPFLRHALDTLGPDRLMYGSNLPVEKISLKASSQVRILRQLLEEMAPEALPAIFSQTARSFYRLPSSA